MPFPPLRPAFLVLCTLCAYEVLGYTPGAINLRTRDLETQIAGSGRPGGRDLKRSHTLNEPSRRA
jgi:hypothetical protein